jgi:hypothetical protein
MGTVEGKYLAEGFEGSVAEVSACSAMGMKVYESRGDIFSGGIDDMDRITPESGLSVRTNI